MNPDAEIAYAHNLVPIAEIAEKAGIPAAALVPYGHTKAKVIPELLPNPVAADPSAARGSLVLVTGISPTAAGEGKSTVLIGLADALNLEGKKAMVAVREPSLGPVLGRKGGATGGGYAQVVPMEDINIHFTGDMHAITAATNSLAALIDNHIFQGNALGIDPENITWQRCLDVNDRALRQITTATGAKTGFTITAASEIMAIICLATDLADLQKRVGAITIGFDFSGQPVTVDQLGVTDALIMLLRDALRPNLVQTLGGTPAFIHGGPFANIAHGCSSLIATKAALQISDVVVTEAGFGADLGAEKFFDIAAREGGLQTSVAVVVASIRSLKLNGGADKEELSTENVAALKRGIVNLERHVENVRRFGVEPVVALNLFSADHLAEREFMGQWAQEHQVPFHEVSVWANGGAGARELARTVIELSKREATSHTLYAPDAPLEEAINTVATEIYGAAKVEYSELALTQLAQLQAQGLDKLPVCISKTPFSFSDDPSQLGAPTGHTLHVRELIARTGAGFVVALTGTVLTMPGLPPQPAANGITINTDSGQVSGLF
ncbi:formate--tetrahydrofolate ligase [Corynebacterium caspium]|uniref:formate--tetrahydrofolate ligase n=1 Tax=Corynebacterium caspium TaxID=234828 RepID=UPI0003719D48|nr:formate--tetrahydrofolate ligase [Corynebacterium caspium]WKD59290.1 Formate--tetrahydrofolate ligase [Corynebacterium caspium DSM 44850]